MNAGLLAAGLAGIVAFLAFTKKSPAAPGGGPVNPNPPPTPKPLPPQPVLPPNAIAFPNPGSMAYVATQDTGPDGDLNIRYQPSTAAAIVGRVSHGSSLQILGAADATGEWYPVESPGGMQGWAWSGYLVSQPLSDVGSGTNSGDTPPGQEVVHNPA